MANKVFLIGNLTHDIELTQTHSGVSVCKFTIAVNRNYTDSNGARLSDFINIVAWRSLAENCGKYLSKGKKVAVCGSIQTRNYEDKNGNKRTVTEIVADDVEFLGGGKNESTAANTVPQQGKKEAKQVKFTDLKPIDDDDFPF